MVERMYLLDSDIIIAMLRDVSDKTGIRKRLLKIGLDHCFVSEITLAELSSGAYKMGSDRGFFELSFVRSILTPLPFGAEGEGDSLHFGEIKSSLQKAGVPWDDMDMLIASTALTGNLILATHNRRHFSRIPGLKTVDWLSSLN